MRKKRIITTGILVGAMLLSGCGGTAPANTPVSSTAGTESTQTTEAKNKETEQSETVAEKNPSTSWEMNKNGMIEETVIYEEDGLKITAKEIEYTSRTADVILLIENDSDKDLSVYAGTLGYSCNAINGYMVSGGYINADVNAGKKVSETARFSYDDLMCYGITEIADIEFGFTIHDGKDYNYTDPVKIETTFAASHDYETDTYPEAIQSAATLETMDYTLGYFGSECLYDQGGFKLLSYSAINNSDDETTLILEFENTNDKMLYVVARDITINGLLVSSGSWTSEAIIGHHKGFITIQLDHVLSQELYEVLGIQEIGEVGMDITINKHDGTEMELPKHLSIKLKEGNYSYDSGNEVYNDHGIRIISKGFYQEKDDYSPNIHILMIAENNGTDEVTIGDKYDSFSVNDFMVGCFLYSKTIEPETIALLDIEIPDYNFDDAEIETVEDIKSAEITLEIRNKNYKMIDEPKITFEAPQ